MNLCIANSIDDHIANSVYENLWTPTWSEGGKSITAQNSFPIPYWSEPIHNVVAADYAKEELPSWNDKWSKESAYVSSGMHSTEISYRISVDLELLNDPLMLNAFIRHSAKDFEHKLLKILVENLGK